MPLGLISRLVKRRQRPVAVSFEATFFWGEKGVTSCFLWGGFCDRCAIVRGDFR